MRKYIAETIATFALVLCGTGAIVIDDAYNGIITHVGISLTFGLIVMLMVYCFGSISGAHMNPAVTLGLAWSGKFPIRQILPYVLSQLSGAIAASLVIRLFFPLSKMLGATLPQAGIGFVFCIEACMTFFLMLVILQVISNPKETKASGACMIGGMVTLAALVAGPVSGASINPARSIGPALVSGHLTHLWIYILAPVAGAVLAVIFQKIFRSAVPT